jgi:hypothetical protein
LCKTCNIAKGNRAIDYRLSPPKELFKRVKRPPQYDILWGFKKYVNRRFSNGFSWDDIFDELQECFLLGFSERIECKWFSIMEKNREVVSEYVHKKLRY